jgi:hypothetical protein
MPEEAGGLRDWVGPLCQIAVNWNTRDRNVPLRTQFETANPDLVDEARFKALVRERLLQDPTLMAAWQGYSQDKRVMPSPYIEGRAVGYFKDVMRHGVRTHKKLVNACADFIYREACWILDHGQPPWFGAIPDPAIVTSVRI